MKITKFMIMFLMILNLQADVTLNGQTTTIEDIVKIANGEKVLIDENAREKAKIAFDVLLQAAREGQKIYGFTVGVGWNKDKTFIDPSGNLDKELIKSSILFNEGLIKAHVGAVGDILDEKTARAIMATRLNMALSGNPGLQPAFLDTLKDMLNKNITPLIPNQGSIGQADITVLGHLALNLIAKGDVLYKGKVTPAKEAFEQEGIKIVKPFAKDALAILSTNAYSLSLGALNTQKLKQITKMQKLIYALSLEALNGNLSPLLSDNVATKGFIFGINTAKEILTSLKGSYLWQKSDKRAVQDPLSFRDAQWIISILDESIHKMQEKLNIQINHSDDNPSIAVGVKPNSNEYEITRRYVKNGALFSSSNFDPTPWII